MLDNGCNTQRTVESLPNFLAKITLKVNKIFMINNLTKRSGTSCNLMMSRMKDERYK